MEELNAVQNEKLMDETIKHELERIKDLTPGSNEYKAAYECAAKFYEIRVMSWIFSCICPMTTVWRWLSGMGTSINRYRIRINGSILYSTTLEQKVGTVSRRIPLFFIARTTPIRSWSRLLGGLTG